MTATTSYAFGTGSVYAIVSGLAPVKVGVLQDIEVDISASSSELYGQYQFPVAVGRGKAKLEGKAKTGQFDLNLLNSLFTQGTIDATGYLKAVENEAHSVPGSVSYTVQVTNNTGGITDLGVFYSTTGVQLTPVTAGSEATGKYSVDLTTGTYTFAVGDASAALLFNYRYKATTGSQVVVANALMGAQPIFELFLQEGFTDYGARTNTTMKLHRCMSSKLTFPFKNTDFMISDFDFAAFADSSGNVMTIGIGT